MLKITKGLRQFVNDDSEGIHAYTDKEGEGYVRVKIGGEDFCIAPHDYTTYKGKCKIFLWNEAMKSLKRKGMTTFAKEQVVIYREHLDEINNMLKEIGGEPLAQDRYWTSTESDIIRTWAARDDDELVWVYNGEDGHLKKLSRLSQFMIRPIINL